MNRTIPTLVAAVALAAVAAPARQARAAGAGVHDGAKLFSAAAVEAAERGLRAVEAESPGHWQVRVETVDSLGGKSPRAAAVEAGEAARVKGLVVLVAKKEKHVQVEPSGSAEAEFPEDERARVVAALTHGFKANDFDRGLRDAVAEIKFAALGVGVRDAAGMFSHEAVAKADEALDALCHKTHLGAAVETVDTLKGLSPRDAAVAGARALKVHGLYVVISRGDRKVDAEPSRSAESAFTTDRIRAVDAALASAFKAGEFDRGLHDAVAAIRTAAESAPATTTAAAPTPPPISLPRPADTPHPPEKPPAAGPAPEVKEAGSVLPVLLLGAGALLVGLWVFARLFRRPAAPPQQQPAYGPGYPAGAPMPQQPGYAPRPGYPPQPQAPPPGYGYGPQPQAPPPGYGYGPQPQAPGRGGGMLGGVLGGLGGAIAGNLLYDQMTHHHDGQGQGGGQGPAHVPGGAAPPTGGGDWSNNPGPPAGAGVPPVETYDPNAGVGASRGTPDDPAPAPAPDGGSTGGSWGAPDEPADAGGSWGTPDEPAASNDADTGGSWGADEPADADAGGGGDWGGGDPGGGNADDQGGNW